CSTPLRSPPPCRFWATASGARSGRRRGITCPRLSSAAAVRLHGRRLLHRLHQRRANHFLSESMGLNRDDAWTLLTEYTRSESLLKHAMAVEAAVRGYARRFGEDEDDWGVTALLHDFDYERWPTLGDHPNKGAEILRAKGYPDWMIRAIL